MRRQLAMFSACADQKSWGGEGEARCGSNALILVLTFSW